MSESAKSTRMADTLGRGEERFRTLVETIPAAVFLHGDGKTLYVNQAAERIGGYSRDELLEMDNFWQLVHPDSRPRLMEIYEAHARGETIPTEHEVKVLTKGGESRWILFTFGWMTSGPERGVLLGTAVDITERKVAEDTLREESDQLQAVFNAFPALLVRLDRCGTILDFTASPKRPLYRRPEEFLGKLVSDVLPRTVASLVGKAIAIVGESGAATTIEYALPFPAGERFFETQFVPFGEDQILVLARDVTDRKEAEAALRESEARLLAFAHALPDVAFILDEDGYYVEILGRPEKSDLLYSQARELQGRRLHDVLPRESADAFLATIRETIQTQQPQVLEYELDVPAGHRYFEGRTAPLPLDGVRRMVVWLALDITARKSAEQALVELREELDRKAEHVVSRGNEYGLTFRELTVLQLVVAGKSDKEIGAMLGISPFTANKHVANIFHKVNVSSRTSASVIALRDGLVS